ncbi:MAG: DUF4432 family protein [Phycisphaeraceae bacterium]|nr:DUF4432 family protein [Phycisphaeraceae bacterium]
MPAMRRVSSSAKPASAATSVRSMSAGPLDLSEVRCDNVQQLGGIRTGTLDYPNAGGHSHAARVAMINTGSPLRFVVALDRGGDIVEAFHGPHSLAYLSPNDYAPPSLAARQGILWLDNWPAGLVTTCGPRYIGPPRKEDGLDVALHGNHSNTPASIEMLVNPDPARGRREMLLSLIIREARMFQPVVEVRRQIQCLLGEPMIHIYDQVTNRSNITVAHNWMYHCNFGYPLADAGTRLVYRGKAMHIGREATAASLKRFKTLAGPRPEHRGKGEDVVVIDPQPDRQGVAHVGLVNARLGLGVELEYDVASLPRLTNWQHLGPAGSYVTGVEPFCGSLLGKDNDKHPKAAQWLEPGQTRSYHMTIRVLEKPQLKDLLRHDGEMTVAKW